MLPAPSHRLLPALLLPLLLACQPDSQSQPTPPRPQTVSVASLAEQDHYQQLRHFSGSVRAGNTTAVSFELGGKLNQLPADSGDSVSEGQVLARLDTALLQAELAQITAALAQNQVDLDLAMRTLSRSQTLGEKSYLSDQQLDELQGRRLSLLADKQRLQASRRTTELKLEKSVLTAPFAGTLAQRHHSLGEVINAGSAIFTLVQDNNPQAHIGVPADVARTLTPGQTLPLTVGQQQLNATLAGISSAIDPLTRTVNLRLRLPTDAGIFNGEIARFAFRQKVAQSGFWVPVSALTDGIRGRWNLLLLRPDEQGYTLERRDVDILYTDEQRAFISGNLNNHQRYVRHGLHKLVAGQTVLPATEAIAGHTPGATQ
ncbi:RND transporter MFP subunit [Shewanella sp. NFH-SH190041]|uniref:efflux RND transporter periplasmic adaptor subunit n=1 Tax=Shewanella sp. NFH-SH190041 TaxID=2950245 RepID=UPI0021C2B711|nr:efflux RND transporter periplasmic adaptor subunit [Shewanella sp. NFH-SH190041]BDM63722.1 RND transporter MFP subunit [Shewanella sp. NFH-SH190041]